MSTKNLARTVIEGGRFPSDKYDRRQSLRYWRHDNRRFCDAVLSGSVDADETPAPARDVGFRWRDEIHDDKTAPTVRFLASRAGRPWNDVRSEIHRKFNTRTLAGWHVVYAHLIDAVEDWGSRFSVDDEGVLRYHPRHRWNYGESWRIRPIIWEWAAGRRVRLVGERPYWFTPTTVATTSEPARAYRQGMPLDRDDLESYGNLTNAERAALTGL